MVIDLIEWSVNSSFSVKSACNVQCMPAGGNNYCIIVKTKSNLRVHLLVCNWSGELNNKKRNTAIKPKITAEIKNVWFHIF